MKESKWGESLGRMFRHSLGRGLNMYAVGRLGTYISHGVYTVAGPFHPFGGAVDIIVVQQEDGSFKSSPWYVKFGKFQGVLKRSEKLVDVAVNDVAVKFHMYLDSTGNNSALLSHIVIRLSVLHTMTVML